MKNTITTLLVIVLFTGIFTVIYPIKTCNASSTIHVYNGESLQDAIDSANESDTIIVHGGSYSNIEIDKTLTLTGDGGEVQISSNSQRTVKITANDVHISGFEILNYNKAQFCVYLYTVTGCQVNDNVIRAGSNGVYLQDSNSNTINGNTISYNNIGLYLSNSDSNTIYSNVISNNNGNGVFLSSSSSGNTFYLNDFDDNMPNNARDEGSNNWDDGSKGNYWDDYSDKDEDGNGIGDSAYGISGSGGGQDNYPKGDFLTTNNKPIATINSPSGSVTIDYGYSLYFSGIGEDEDSGDTIEAYKWTSSKDGQLSTQSSFYTSSLSAGTHTIYFEVMDNHNDWSDQKSVTVTVEQDGGGQEDNQIPTALILRPSGSVSLQYGNSIEFRGQGSDSDGDITEYSWRSDIDGIISSSRQFINNDLTVGGHTIYFKVRDNLGEWSSEVSITVTITSVPSNNPPVANAGGPYSGYVDQAITFDGSGSSDPDAGDSVTSYQWNFGDGSTGEGASIEHTYTTEGTFTVELAVVDSNGEQTKITTTCTISVVINDDPGSGDGNDGEDNGLPGFETVFLIMAIALILFYKKRK